MTCRQPLKKSQTNLSPNYTDDLAEAERGGPKDNHGVSSSIPVTLTFFSFVFFCITLFNIFLFAQLNYFLLSFLLKPFPSMLKLYSVFIAVIPHGSLFLDIFLIFTAIGLDPFLVNF